MLKSKMIPASNGSNKRPFLLDDRDDGNAEVGKRRIKPPNRLTFEFVAASKFRCDTDSALTQSKSSDRDLNFKKEFIHDDFNANFITMIEESDDPDLETSIASNHEALSNLQSSVIKVTLNGPITSQNNEYVSLVQDYNPDWFFQLEVSSALVGTKVPIKISFQAISIGKLSSKYKTGYIFSLQDVEEDGYLVYYLSKGNLIAERMLPQDFVLSRLESSDHQTILQISNFLSKQQQQQQEKSQSS